MTDRHIYYAGQAIFASMLAAVAVAYWLGHANRTALIVTAIVVPFNMALLRLMWALDRLYETLGVDP